VPVRACALNHRSRPQLALLVSRNEPGSAAMKTTAIIVIAVVALQLSGSIAELVLWWL
jgi:hypothetical protein